jgi:hypothetical protein
MKLVTEIAQLLYSQDSSYEWVNEDHETHAYYYSVADVLIDAVISHLETKHKDFAGGFSGAIEYLRSETEIARLRRELV